MAIRTEKPVKNFLQDFGLTDKEVTVYLTLLKSGPNTIMNLARETGIKRSTTHNTVEELVKKGLVSQTNYGERRMVVAEDPQKLEFLLEQRKWEMKKIEDNLKGIVENIYETIPQSKENTKVDVKYYNGEKGFKEVCQRSLDHSTNEVLFITNVDEWRKVYTEEYGREYYIPERLKRKIFLKALAPRNPGGEKFKGDDKELMRETRFLPESYKFTPTVIICDDEVSIMISGEPYTAIVIENKEVAQMYREMFNDLWNKYTN